MSRLTLTGLSDKPYDFDRANPQGTWKAVPGNYAMVDSRGRPVYIGQTGDFSERKPGPAHERWDEARRLGAVAVYAHANWAGEQARKAEEADLIAAYDPPLNKRNRLATNRPEPGRGGLLRSVPLRRSLFDSGR